MNSFMTPESIRIALSIKGLSHYHNRHVILFCFRYYAILWLSKSVHNEIESRMLECLGQPTRRVPKVECSGQPTRRVP